MRVIGVAGRRGSGKGVFAEAARELGLPVFEMSDIVVERMLKTKILITNRSLREFADRLRKRFGKDFVARKTIERMRRERGKAKAVVVVGIRSPAEVKRFRGEFGGFVLVALSAPLRLRWKRIWKRKRPEDARTFEEFAWAEKTEEKWGLGKALKMAGVKMRNAESREKFRSRAKKLLGQV